MKKLLLLVLAIFLTAENSASAANIILPAPAKNGGKSVLEAISDRSSAAQQNFKKEEIPLNDLATILWAATGKNREPKGWTIPLAMGREPYVSIYVLTRRGAYLYDWNKSILEEIMQDNKLLSRSVLQDFAKTAPCCLVFVSSGKMNIDTFNYLAAGAMSQNTYLAADALGYKARFLASFNKGALETSLMLMQTKTIIGVMVIGKQ